MIKRKPGKTSTSKPAVDSFIDDLKIKNEKPMQLRDAVARLIESHVINPADSAYNPNGVTAQGAGTIARDLVVRSGQALASGPKASAKKRTAKKDDNETRWKEFAKKEWEGEWIEKLQNPGGTDKVTSVGDMAAKIRGIPKIIGKTMPAVGTVKNALKGLKKKAEKSAVYEMTQTRLSRK